MNITASGVTKPSPGSDPATWEAHGYVGRLELEVSTLDGWVKGVSFHCDHAGDPECAFANDGYQQLEHIECP
jgi:hypothetical protein